MTTKTPAKKNPVSGMKIAAIALLLVIVGLLLVAAIAAAPWLFVPLVVGTLTAWMLLKAPKWPWLATTLRVTKVIAGAVAVALVAWLVLSTHSPSVNRSVASAMNTRVASAAGTPAAASAPSGLSSLERGRLELAAAFQAERQKLQLISQALALEVVADARYVQLGKEGHPDEKLEEASNALEKAFSTERTVAPGQTLKPLDPRQLDDYLQAARQAIDRTEAKDLAMETDEQGLLKSAQGIRSALAAFDLDTLYHAATTLQERLKDSLQLRLAPDAVYSERYDREADALVARQEIHLRLADTPAASVDLTDFFTSGKRQLGLDVAEDVSVQEDGGPQHAIDPKTPVYQLRSDVRELIVVKSVSRQRAAEPVLPGRLPVQLSQVRVDWPPIRTSSVTLALQQHRDSPGNTWPFVVPIEVPDSASLARVTMPRNSVVYVDPMTPVTASASGDELAPTAVVGNLRRLSSSDVIRVELLPAYLSNAAGQKFKDYLEIENLWAAVVVWGLTVGLFALFKSD